MASEQITVAEAYLELLSARGVRYFFGNSGTDFAPIIEAFAKRKAQGKNVPYPITVPHEITAVAMAHGYTMVTGDPQVVMVHVIAGTANALGGIINAARAQVPMLFTAGRTPWTEKGHRGARNLCIHWAQESFDQGAMVREFVKWDYELRLGSQLETVVDRALAITRTEPCAPVYLTLPREVLSQEMEGFEYSSNSRVSSPGPAAPNPDTVNKAAKTLASARNPVAIAQSLGRDPEAVGVLISLAETLNMPVVEFWHTHLNFPQDHPLHGGYDPSPFLKDADVVLALEADVPWIPELSGPSAEAKVIQIASDPLFSSYPIRGFPADISLSGSPRLSLLALKGAIESSDLDPVALRARLERWSSQHQKLHQKWRSRAERVRTDSPINMAWASHCVHKLIDDRSIVINEYDLDPAQTCFHTPGTYFRYSPSASLGWGMGAALGTKLAKPDHRVICCVGDGAYMFGVPVSAHFVSRAYNLPLLFVVFNNGHWNASRQATFSFAPGGWATKSDPLPLCELEPSPAYEMICQAAGGYGERVEDPEELPKALDRALRAIETEKRQALINIICKKN